MLALVAAAFIASASSASAHEAGCAALLTQAVARGAAKGVPAACWRIGPLMLGMSEDAVEQRLGMPVAVADGGIRYHAELYAFPASASGPSRVTTKVRLVELRYLRGTLVAIDTAPGYRVESEPCAGRPGRVRAGDFDGDAVAGPLLAFNGVRVGDPTGILARRFGRPAATNRSRDWFSYLPLPVSFDVDPDPGRIVGMTVATDEDALTTASMPLVRLGRDPASCRVTAVNYGWTTQ